MMFSLFVLRDPITIISFERNSSLLDNSNMAVAITTIHKPSAGPAGIEYKLGIQVSQRIKNQESRIKFN
jgi:hypothetical protein